MVGQCSLGKACLLARMHELFLVPVRHNVPTLVRHN